MPRRSRRCLLMLLGLVACWLVVMHRLLPQHAAAPLEQRTPPPDPDVKLPARPPLSLRQALSSRHERPVFFDGYAGTRKPGRASRTWNALTYIRLLLQLGGNYEMARVNASRPLAESLASASLLITPNYWADGATDWREWRLAPHQRLARRWGMKRLSQKTSLHRTLSAHYGEAGCPFLPETHDWHTLRSTDGWADVVRSRPFWLLKTNQHQGQGVKLTSADDLIAATRVGSLAGSPLAPWLHSSSLLQQPVAPSLVAGRKYSLRLYSVITSANPLRVYVHTEGFALFAASRYETDSTDPTSVLTNAYVNAKRRRGDADAASARGDAGAADATEAAVARSLGIELPPRTQRWSLNALVDFVEARRRRQGAGGGGEPSLLRQLHRLVLGAWVAARKPLAEDADASMRLLGLEGQHEYAAAYELTAFDILVDELLRPWLLEINTTPSLVAEEASRKRPPQVAEAIIDEARGGGGDGGGGARRLRGELPSKMRMLRDMLALIDALPEPAPPPERLLVEELLRENGGGGDSCARRWKLGGCAHCPAWREVVELWRSSVERRRAGGFIPLSPSLDPEWAAMADGGDADGGGRRPSAHALLRSWLRPESDAERAKVERACPPPGRSDVSEACIRARWDAMLC